MGAPKVFLIVACMALLVPTSQAEGDAGAPVVDDLVDCGPPCGYILPILDIQVEDKQACGGGRLIYAEGPPEDCEDLMADGESVSYDAKLLWYWEVSEDGTYPKEAGEDIVISFSGTATNPRWLTVDVAGDGMTDGTFVLTDADLVDPANFVLRENSQEQQSLWFWYERDITITFTRNGSPTGDDLDRIENREGVQVFFLKAKSSESGPRFKEAFGVEEFRFNSCADEGVAQQVKSCAAAPATEGQKTPALPLLATLGLLVALAVARRR